MRLVRMSTPISSSTSVMQPIAEAIIAFLASNIDELIVSILQFAEARRNKHEVAIIEDTAILGEESALLPRNTSTSIQLHHVMLGQLLGFTGVVVVSLIGFALNTFISREWIGLIGFLPIVMGLRELTHECRKLYKRKHRHTVIGDPTNANEQTKSLNNNNSNKNAMKSTNDKRTNWSSRTLYVAAIAFASGSDSIGVYVPLFAAASAFQVVVLIGIFYIIFGVWLFFAYQLVSFPMIASMMKEYGEFIGPVMLMFIGIYVLYDCNTIMLLR